MAPAAPAATPSAPRPDALWGWFQLFRPPNLFTVPGDVIAGVALAAGGFDGVSVVRLGLAVLIALLLYSAGLLLNDYFDRAIDAVERPRRPIPSGAVAASAVLVAGLGLVLAALLLGLLLGPVPLLATVVLAALVVAYDSFAKRWAWLGVPTMAACRVASLGLGAAVGTGPGGGGHGGYVALAGAVLFLYLVVVTAIARRETDTLPGKGWVLLVGAMPFLLLLSGLQRLTGPGCPYVWVVWTLGAVNLWLITRALWTLTDVRQTPRCIGALIRHLIFLQAFWVAAGGGWCYWVMGVLALWPLGGWAGRKFYGS